mgnify:CR=1 FL=1
MPRARRTTPVGEGVSSVMDEHTTTVDQATQTAEAPTSTQANVLTDTSSPHPKVDVRITATRNNYDDPIRAFATLTLNDCFVIKGIRVVKGENGLYCSMPARKLRSGEYSEVCHAITPDFSRSLNASVLNQYQVHLAQQMEESQQTPHIYEPDEPVQVPEQTEPEQTTQELNDSSFEPEMGM